ncbi:hypothetical protein J8281_07740 [Aquimarina sp. U1-2]|uniref:hypothetical protein n=1 Tax=Aquimarina sp. U1-2 TaxID=2823141 RepID=UPI001AECBFAB|nr:hypothetical protein [Aquimarina sp. U1-2]MBP2832080.1 hypothetical protein [Aquimarina sp. U1-2]
MIKNIGIPFLSTVVLLLFFSCKKDPKATNFEAVEYPVDSTYVEGENKGVVIKNASTKKKKKSYTKKKKKNNTKRKTAKDDAVIRIPGTFERTSNSYAKKYIKDYERYVANYKKAVEANDMDSFLKLSNASSDLSRQYNRLMSILPGEEIEKLSQYMEVKSKQINALSAKM